MWIVPSVCGRAALVPLVAACRESGMTRPVSALVEIGAVLFLWWIAVGSMILLADDAVLVAAKAALYRDITPWALGAVFSVFGLDAVLKSRAGDGAP